MPAIAEPVPLSDHLYVVYSEFPHVDASNVYLLTGSTPTLIDCGSPRAAPQLVRNLAQLGIGVRDLHQVIVTHGDFDHIQGFHALREANPDLLVHLHPGDWAGVQEPDAYRNSSYVYGQPFQPFARDGFLPLAQGQVIAAGETELTVYHAPGHTEGSVCLHGRVDGHSILFAGDAIGGSMKSLTGADLQVWFEAVLTWQQSLQQLARLEYEWVLNGHEPARTLPIPRRRVDRLMASFGTMLNPWFTLGEEPSDTEGALAPGPEQAAIDRPAALAGDLQGKGE